MPKDKRRQFPTKIHQRDVKGIYKLHPHLKTLPIAASTITEVCDYINTGLNLESCINRLLFLLIVTGEPLILNTENLKIKLSLLNILKN